MGYFLGKNVYIVLIDCILFYIYFNCYFDIFGLFLNKLIDV